MSIWRQKRPIDTTQRYGFAAETIQHTVARKPIASDLATSWINGNREHVLNILSVCAPHVTAMVMKIIARTDGDEANTLANLLTERFFDAKSTYQQNASVGSNPYASEPIEEDEIESCDWCPIFAVINGQQRSGNCPSCGNTMKVNEDTVWKLKIRGDEVI